MSRQARVRSLPQTPPVVLGMVMLAALAAIGGARHNTTVAALDAANPGIKNLNRIYPGDTIRLPNSTAAAATPAPRASTPTAAAPSGNVGAPVAAHQGAPAGKTSDLRAMFNPALGSNAPAAIIIGNAEGTRTPTGGKTWAYAGHIDPGNGVGNRGSFSYQHGEAGMTPAQADTAQLTKLTGQIPAFEAAARKAGIDPNNIAVATAYFDLFNQSESAAARFLNQIGYLKDAGVSTQSLTELRFRSFVDVNTGSRFLIKSSSGKMVPCGGGFANIAKDGLQKKGIKRAPTEGEIHTVIRADQARRENAMARAMAAQLDATPARATPTGSATRINGNEVARENGVIVRDNGVRISRLDKNMAPVISAVAQAARTLGLPTPVITSGNDSRHKSGSLHYADRGLDFRGNNISNAQGVALQNEVRRILGDKYDVQFEIFPRAPSNDHLHVEFDPK